MGCLGCVYDHVALAKINKRAENKNPLIEKNLRLIVSGQF